MHTDTTLDVWDLADPAALIADVAERSPLTPGTVLAALIRNSSTVQELVHLHRIDTDCREVEESRISGLLRTAVDEFPTDGVGRPIDHLIMTIVVRPGLTVFTTDELAWMVGWRQVDHWFDAFAGGLMLVTEHGWLDLDTGWGGREPRMLDSMTSASPAPTSELEAVAPPLVGDQVPRRAGLRLELAAELREIHP